MTRIGGRAGAALMLISGAYMERGAKCIFGGGSEAGVYSTGESHTFCCSFFLSFWPNFFFFLYHQHVFIFPDHGPPFFRGVLFLLFLPVNHFWSQYTYLRTYICICICRTIFHTLLIFPLLAVTIGY